MLVVFKIERVKLACRAYIKFAQLVMSFFSCTGKAKKKIVKFGLLDIFRNPVPKTHAIQPETDRLNKFVNELASDTVSYKAIQQLAWNGVPHCLRPKVWKYLLRYALIHNTQESLNKKRKEYETLLGNYWNKQQSDGERKILHTIEGDVKRIGTEFNASFKMEELQLMITRMLYIWHMRHPASGYVQGMCDLVNPFLIVFLSEYLPMNPEKMEFEVSVKILGEDTLMSIQADLYWCTSKMLEYVIKNYTAGFGGLHEAYSQVQELLQKIDQQLFNHLKKQKIDLFNLSFRNISTMLLRMFTPLVGVRLFDSYISYEEEYPSLMIFLLIAVIEKFGKTILSLKGDNLMTFMQKLPTKEWGQCDIEVVLAEAYVYKKLFQIKH